MKHGHGGSDVREEMSRIKNPSSGSEHRRHDFPHAIPLHLESYQKSTHSGTSISFKAIRIVFQRILPAEEVITHL